MTDPSPLNEADRVDDLRGRLQWLTDRGEIAAWSYGIKGGVDDDPVWQLRYNDGSWSRPRDLPEMETFVSDFESKV